MFSCHLHFFTEWPVSFTCYCSNTGGTDTEISQQRKQTPELLMWGLEPTTSPSRVQRSATELPQLPTFYSEHVHVCVCACLELTGELNWSYKLAQKCAVSNCRLQLVGHLYTKVLSCLKFELLLPTYANPAYDVTDADCWAQNTSIPNVFKRLIFFLNKWGMN